MSTSSSTAEEFVEGATVKEESARTRQLREHWKEQPPPPAQPWRSWEGEALRYRMTSLSAQEAADRAEAGESGKAGKQSNAGKSEAV